jgi:acyl-CoA thioester hydrolase
MDVVTFLPFQPVRGLLEKCSGGLGGVVVRARLRSVVESAQICSSVVMASSVHVHSYAIDPTKSTTATPMRVRFFETDLMGIVHHAAYFTYFEVGRVEWLRQRGLRYADVALRGIHLPVVEAKALYRAPCRFDDDLTVETTLTKLRSVSLDYAYRISRGTTRIAEGFTRLACIDADSKLLRIPGDIRDALLRGEGEMGSSPVVVSSEGTVL